MRVGFAFGLCIMLLSLVAGDRGFPAVSKARRQARQIAGDIAALKTENKVLREDARTIELVARETLGLARAGEMIVVRRP